eukprot:CAMPEP_0172660374 /NCGR_PEP_ID=MMETSP1074-20121228/4036_1 /TAXON_ID=2916 /ORGANISM="Ceratium fusus, Strain PA161109" /LENGTH=106 /DNA_ID=CAMNT_0013475991 /DNA_START=29 /DNA_END=346 /DNA_ORIENTATION=+
MFHKEMVLSNCAPLLPQVEAVGDQGHAPGKSGTFMRPLPTVSGDTVEKERWYLATVIFNKEYGKYDIEWEGDYGNAIKDAEDIAPAGHRQSTSGHDCLVEQSRAVH